MPLYTACPCRKESTPYMAQMMRIFIATPPANLKKPMPASKADNEIKFITKIKICIAPRVQPNPLPCPLFWPSQPGPIRLTDNSVWVLRLP